MPTEPQAPEADAAATAPNEGAAQNGSAGRELLLGSALYSAGILAGKILGLVRQILMQQRFGPGLEQDAFLLAESAPRQASAQLTDLERSGTIPVLSRLIAAGHVERARRAQTWAMVFTGAALVVFAGVAWAWPWLIARWVTPGSYAPPEADLVARLTRSLVLILLVEGVAGLGTAAWLAWRRYALPGLAHMIPNAVAVGVLWLGGGWLTVELYAWGVVSASLAFAVTIVLPLVLSHRLWRALAGAPPWGDLRDVVALALPLLAPAVLGPVTLAVERIRAGSLPPGTLSCLQAAQTIVEAPMGTLIAATGTVLLPVLAHQAATGTARFGERLFEILRIVLLLVTPAAALLLVHAPTVVGLMLERGRFLPEHTAETASFVRVLAWSGLMCALQAVHTQAAIALERPSVASTSIVAGMALRVVAATYGFQVWGLDAILWAAVVSPALIAWLIAVRLRRSMRMPSASTVVPFVVRWFVAGAVVLAVAWALEQVLPAESGGAADRAVRLVVNVAGSLGIYLGAVRLLHPEDFSALKRRLRRRSDG